MEPSRITPPPGPELKGDERFRGLHGVTVTDFWRYAMPDLRTNTTRGLLAQFLVQQAVGGSVRPTEWDHFDVQTAESHDSYDPLDVGQWGFYVAPRDALAALGQKSVGLATVRRLCGEAVGLGELAHVIRRTSAVTRERDDVVDTWCERCEMAWCDCPRDGSVPRAGGSGGDSARSFAAWPGMPEAPERAVTIKRNGKAHLYGACDHLEVSVIAAPDFGWVPDAPAGTWQRIGPGNPLRATEGNTTCVATDRCTTCSSSR